MVGGTVIIDTIALAGGKTGIKIQHWYQYTGLNLDGILKLLKNSVNPVLQVDLRMDAMLKKEKLPGWVSYSSW